MLATYMRRMRNNNLAIRIAGSSCRPQLTGAQFFHLVPSEGFSRILTTVFQHSTLTACFPDLIASCAFTFLNVQTSVQSSLF